MKVLIIIPAIDISKGGPSYTTANLCRALVGNGVDVELFTTVPTDKVPEGVGLNCPARYFEPSFPRRFWNSNELVHAVQGVAGKVDIIHFQGLWNLTVSRCAALARKLRIPYVVTAHGMLSAWQRNLGNLHKLIYFAAADKNTVQKAGAMHFLTDIEAESSKRFCGVSPHVVIPNGIWPQEYDNLNADGFQKRFSLNGGPLVLFLGRLHPIKRLERQCLAFSILSERFPRLTWAFIGPDEGMAAEIKKYVETAGLSKRTLLTGLLSRPDVLSALAAATVYCHSSDHEGHSLAVTEALAAGKPCVVTKGCHFDRIETAGAGRVVDSSPDEIAAAIAKILETDELRETMSRNARSLAFENYSWNSVAKQMIELYKMVLHHQRINAWGGNYG
jgi:glycosyltransferase involved in cell wall biosynthesis